MEKNIQQKDAGSRKPLRGIRIRTLNYVMILISVVLYVFLVFVTVFASRKYDAMMSHTDAYIDYQELASLVASGSDYLTEQVRLYAVEMDPVNVREYFKEVYETRSRDGALEKLQEYGTGQEAYAYLHSALQESNRLMGQEIYAMKLVAAAQGQDLSEYEDIQEMELEEQDLGLSPEELVDRARELVFGSSYQDSKAVIEEEISRFLDSVKGNMQYAQQHSADQLKRIMSGQRILISVLFVETIMTFVLILCLIVKPLHIYVNNIKEEKRLDITGAYEFRYLALTYNNIYELNAANELMLRHQAEDLRHQAEHDPLTGIANRGAFEEWKTLLKAKANPLALLIIDVDKFKLVNDGYGHEAGDKVLKKVASLLVETFRETDMPARIGGDEFAVIIVDITIEKKQIIEEKIGSLNQLLMHPEDSLPAVSLSVGGAFSHAGFHDDLYGKADAALYVVKENGRCGCRFYEDCSEEGLLEEG